MSVLELRAKSWHLSRNIGQRLSGIIMLASFVTMIISSVRSWEVAVAAGCVFIGSMIVRKWQRSRSSNHELAPDLPPPAVRIDDEGLEFVDRKGDRLSWGDLATVSCEIEKGQGIYSKAVLHLIRNDGLVVSVNLMPFDVRPEYAVDFVREKLRAFRKIDMATILRAGSDVQCPQCGAATASLKQIEIPMIVCLFIALHVSSRKSVGCRKCCAKDLLIQSIVGVPAANLMWPLLLVFGTLPQMLHLVRSGHDLDALDQAL